MGLPIAMKICAASVQERDGVLPIIQQAKGYSPRLVHIWGDNGFAGRCVEQVRDEVGITLAIVKRPGSGDPRQWVEEGQKPNPVPQGVVVLPWRWIVERTFGWLGRYRRPSKDYEAKPESSLAWIHIAFIRQLVQRFGSLAPT